MTERFNNWTDVANMKDHILILEQRVDFMREKLEAIDKQEPAAYVPYGVFDAWLDQAWLGVKCLNPQLCDPDKVDVQAIYAYPRPEQEPVEDWSEWRSKVVQNLMRHGSIDKDFARRLAHFYQDSAPQSKRQPLTREVIDRDFHGRVDFVRQVEAAHEIKE